MRVSILQIANQTQVDKFVYNAEVAEIRLTIASRGEAYLQVKHAELKGLKFLGAVSKCAADGYVDIISKMKLDLECVTRPEVLAI